MAATLAGKHALITGGGNGTHQVYIAGVPHHRLKDADIVDHLVGLIEKKAAEIEAAKAAEAVEAERHRAAAESRFDFIFFGDRFKAASRE